MGIILLENHRIYLKKGHFSSLFVLHFVGSKTADLGSSAFCRVINSLQNSIYGYAHKFQNTADFYHDFCGAEVMYDQRGHT